MKKSYLIINFVRVYNYTLEKYEKCWYFLKYHHKHFGSLILYPYSFSIKKPNQHCKKIT